jgi:hypothetical protein
MVRESILICGMYRVIQSNRHEFGRIFLGISIIYLVNGEYDTRWELELLCSFGGSIVKAVVICWSIVVDASETGVFLVTASGSVVVG